MWTSFLLIGREQSILQFTGWWKKVSNGGLASDDKLPFKDKIRALVSVETNMEKVDEVASQFLVSFYLYFVALLKGDSIQLIIES